MADIKKLSNKQIADLLNEWFERDDGLWTEENVTEWRDYFDRGYAPGIGEHGVCIQGEERYSYFHEWVKYNV